MSTNIVNKENVKPKWNNLLKLLLGPILFFIVYNIPFEGLDIKAKLCLSIYVWLIAWWVVKPIPWIATSLVPLLLFPILDVMNLKTVVAKLFGQRIMFLLIFVFLLATAIRRCGVGERLSLSLLALRWINGSIDRFIIMYMFATCMMQAIFGIVVGFHPNSSESYTYEDTRILSTTIRTFNNL